MDATLQTPLWWLDHKMRTERGSGEVKWLAHDLENGGLSQRRFIANSTVPVLTDDDG